MTSDPPIGVCRHCHAPVPLRADGKVAAHKEQVLGAKGWVSGYTGCRGAGVSPKPELIEE